jgi:hypothetical protein
VGQSELHTPVTPKTGFARFCFVWGSPTSQGSTQSWKKKPGYLVLSVPKDCREDVPVTIPALAARARPGEATRLRFCLECGPSDSVGSLPNRFNAQSAGSVFRVTALGCFAGACKYIALSGHLRVALQTVYGV